MKVFDLKPDAELWPRVREFFPHAGVRRYQADLANQVYDALSSGYRDLVVEAPTGLGKTASVGAGVMAYAVENGLRILWLTRTGSQVSHVSRELRCLPIYGRRMVCIHETVSKIDLRRFNAACRAVRRAGRCPYWPGFPRAVRPPVTAKEVREIGRRVQACPHDCLIASLYATRIVAATHMQLRVIGWLLAKWRARRERTILVLDEGQHVIKGALSMVKDSISLRTVKRAAKEAKKYGFKDLGEELEEAVKEYHGILSEDGEVEVEDLLPDVSDLALAGDEIQEAKLRENYVPASYVLSLADFKTSLKNNKPILVKEGNRLRLEAPADPVESLRAIYNGWAATVTMSATISGELLESFLGREVTLLRAGWPFGEGNLTAYVVRGLTTKFERRDETLINDMAWAIDLAAKTKKKTLIFLPSHELLQRALARASRKEAIIAESPGLTQEEVEDIIKEYEEDHRRVILSVFNGRLAEGVDLSANLVICLGIPFSPPTPKQQALIKRLSEVLGDERKARIYGQIVPAVWSAIQAAGRAIRGPEDRAVVFLVDDRYRPLRRLLPRWFSERVASTIKLEDLPIVLGEVKTVA